MPSTRFLQLLFVFLSSLIFNSAHAIDGVFLEGGPSSDTDTDYARVGVTWDWEKRWFDNGDWFLSGYWELSAGVWHNSDNTLGDFGITPVFRYQKAVGQGIAPYVEAAIGFHLLTDKELDDDREFSTLFQFGDHIGAGVRFGSRGEYDLGYRFQHLSNGGIDHPNPGINFHQLRLLYHF